MSAICCRRLKGARNAVMSSRDGTCHLRQLLAANSRLHMVVHMQLLSFIHIQIHMQLYIGSYIYTPHTRQDYIYIYI